eukprot:TRINITY_DN11784_c2_g1_i1.p1 TRINITY_DN11784_c2_g1~~TRINITY_DN11784_c2_g1_i1.p1  ORF type:complete len:276 (+),score=73.30 TRINITY_DN11784_c2_g1_i1:104-931(+)
MGCCESREANRGPSGGYQRPLAVKPKKQLNRIDTPTVCSQNNVCETPKEEQRDGQQEEESVSSVQIKCSTIEVSSIQTPRSNEVMTSTITESVISILTSNNICIKSQESDGNLSPEKVAREAEAATPRPVEICSDASDEAFIPPEAVIPSAALIIPFEETQQRIDITSQEASDYRLLTSIAARRCLLLSEMSEFTTTSASRKSKTPLLPDAKTFGYRPCKTVPRKGKRKGRVVWRFPTEPKHEDIKTEEKDSPKSDDTSPLDPQTDNSGMQKIAN